MNSAPWSLRLFVIGLCLACLHSSQAWAQTDPFVGRFEGDIDGRTHQLLVFSDSPGNYDGELRAEGKRLPMSGRRYGEHMIGTIGFPDDSFAFRARVLGAILLIERQHATPLKFFRQSE